MKMGVLSNSLSKDVAQAMDLAAQVGADGVEIQYSDDWAPNLLDPRHAPWLAQQAADKGLVIPSLCLGTVCGRNGLIDSPETLPAAKELIAAACRVARQVKAATVVVPFFGNSLIEVEKELDQAIEVLADLVDAAEEAGVVLGIESTLNFNQCKYLLGQFAHTETVKIYQDTGNALARKLDLPTGLREFGREGLAGIHFKDVTMSAPPDYNVQLGQGNVDFRAVLQSLRAIGYDDWIVLETPAGDDPAANAKANLQFVRDLLSK